jgi:hypothetical protein
MKTTGTVGAAFLTTSNLPPAVRLLPQFDSIRLASELALLESGCWLAEEPYKFEGFFGSDTKVYHDGRWVGLSLRSQGGRLERTDPGGPGLEEFADTQLVQQAPYLASVLAVLNTPLRSARLLRLPPGAEIGEHRDTYHGFEYGQVRLHVPITTNDGVENVIRRQQQTWRPGELWYGDFGSPHSGRNNGKTDRVHLVVDAMITPRLFELFPSPIRAQIDSVDVLLHEDSTTLPGAALGALECEFRLPSTLVRGIFDIDDGIQPELAAAIRCEGDAAYLEVESRRLFKLAPLPNNRLGFVGWTMERYFEYELDGGHIHSLALVLRRGSDDTRVLFSLSHEGRRP